MLQTLLRTLLAAMLCCPALGCFAVYSTRPVDVLVTRTDTNEPAVGVRVNARYLFMLLLNPPEYASGVTDSEGLVTLPLADFDGCIMQAGTTKYGVPADKVREGGHLEYKPSANPDEPVPEYAIQLIPRKLTLGQRLFGWQDSMTNETNVSQPSSIEEIAK